MKASKRLIVQMLSLAALASVLASCSPSATATDQAGSQVASAPVTQITAVSLVSATGPTVALQTVTVAWKTSGTVGEVRVKPGDIVKAGDVLMTISPNSVSADIIQARSNLSTAVKALSDLLNPTALTVANAQLAVKTAQDNLDTLMTPKPDVLANAQQAVAKDQDTLDKAQKALAVLKANNLQAYKDQLQAAQDAMTNAQQNTTVTDIGSLTIQLRQAQDALTTATNVYNNAKDAFAKCPACLTVFAYDRKIAWPDAVNLYNDAVNKVAQVQIQIDQAQRQNASGLTTAQENLTSAQNNLTWALQGPATTTLQVSEAAVTAAQGVLATDQDTLNKLLNPDPTDVAVAKAAVADAQVKLSQVTTPDPTDVLAAQARVAVAKAAVDSYNIVAPVDGEVLEVNYKPGDNAASSPVAVTLGDRSKVRAQVLVDESQVGRLKVGNPVTMTVDALPGLALSATVASIDPVGTNNQGLVKYTVLVDSNKPAPQVLLGMTANAQIITNRQTGALAVPLQALQYDDQGEFVNQVAADGSLNRVAVQSGQIQSGMVIVSGNLKSGDQVELATTQASASANQGGGAGGFFGLLGGGGGGGRPQP